VAAIVSIFAGLLTFTATKIITMDSLALEVGLPVIVSTITYILIGLVRKNHVSDKVKKLEAAIAD
jgi:hypothetical protein